MTRPIPRLILPLAALAAVFPSAALAYIGPGAGLGAIVVTAALIVGVILLVVGLVWYPLKRMLRSKAQASADPEQDTPPRS